MTFTRKAGGALLGEGAKGVVYDIYDPEMEISLHSILTKKIEYISKIVLYSTEGKSSLTKSDINLFTDYLKTTKGVIAKIIKNNNSGKKSTKRKLKIKKRIDDEIISNRKIMNILGEASDKYLTINPGLKFNGIKFYACHIVYKRSFKRKYIIFGKKCGFISHIEIDTLIRDIIDILKLCENKVIHNDIKLENIMYCGGKYKLIDWGNATFNNELRGGLFMDPLKYYFCGGDIKDSIDILPRKMAKKYPDIYNSKLFKTTYERITEEFINLSKEQIQKNTYKGNHDLFSLGMTIIQIVITKHINPTKYIPLINLLTSYKNPPTISDALRFITN